MLASLCRDSRCRVSHRSSPTPFRFTALMMVVLLGQIGAVHVQAAIPSSERQVLVNLYNETNGANWFNSGGWLDVAGTECSWRGVYCDPDQSHVYVIDLPENNLAGSLPSLAALTYLQGLSVRNNQLTGPIPPLVDFPNIQEFLVNNNQLTGPIPSLTGLANLRIFTADDNNLDGQIPPLTGLTNLFWFSVSNNQLDGQIPPLSDLTSLRWFEASHNQLDGPIPILAGLTIDAFSASNNNLSGQIPSLLSITSLSIFDVSSNQLNGPFPLLTGLTGIIEFRVGNNLLLGNSPDVPALNSLSPGQSSLCPNTVIYIPSAIWDAATGQAPWFQDCIQLLDPIFDDGFDG